MSAGIDYGMGDSNIDKATGVRFGVINLNSEPVSEWAWESFEADYGNPTCGHCGNELDEYDSEKHCEYDDQDGFDYACETCERTIDSQDAYGEEPIGWVLDDGEYQATASADGDCFILKSPYFTHAQFCSPCAPGAGHLAHPCDDGPRTYCFGHDWFRGRVAPYAVYRVDNGQRVYPNVSANPAPAQEE